MNKPETPRNHFPRALIVIAGVVIGLMLLCGLALIPVVLVQATASARDTQCKKNLHDLGIAYNRFAATRGETATLDLAERWTADLIPVVSGADLFVCPADEVPTVQESGIAISYGMNSQVRSRSVLATSQVLMADFSHAVIDFDGVDSEHESEYVDLRHNGGVNVLYGDGSVRGQSGREFFDPMQNHWQGKDQR